MNDYWPVVAAVGVGTFLIRFSFIGLANRIRLPEPILAMLRFIPAAVLIALVAPAILLQEGALLEPGNRARPIAAALAFLVAWRTGNVLATIATGMVALWLIQWLA